MKAVIYARYSDSHQRDKSANVPNMQNTTALKLSAHILTALCQQRQTIVPNFSV